MESNSKEDRSPDQCLLGEIKRLMTQQKLSQAELAKLLEVSPSYVSQVFRGKKRLTSRFSEKTFRALGTPHSRPLESSPQKTPGCKPGSGYNYEPHLRFMARQILEMQVLAKHLSKSKAAKRAEVWANENGHTAVSWETLRKKFSPRREELLEAERRSQSQSQATPSSCAPDRQKLARKHERQWRGGSYPPDEATGLRELKKALGDLGDRLFSSPEDALSSYFGEDLEVLSLKGTIGESAYSELADSMGSAIKTLRLTSDPDFDPFATETFSELVEASLPESLRTLPPDSPQIRQLRNAISQRAKELRRFRVLG